MANPVRADQLQAQSPATVEVLKDALGVSALDGSVSRLSSIQADVAATLETVSFEAGKRTGSSLATSNGIPYQAIAVGWLCPADGGVDSFTFSGDNVNFNTTLRLKIWERDAGNGYTGSPSSANGDTLLSATDVAASKYSNTAAVQDVAISFPWVKVTQGMIYIFEVDAFLSDGVTPGKIGYTYGATADTRQDLKGYYKNGSGAWNGTNTSGAAGMTYLITRSGVIKPRLYDDAAPASSVSSLTVDLSGTAVENNGRRLSVSGSVTLDPTSTPAAVTNTNKALVYDNSITAAAGGTVLKSASGISVRNISNAVVKRTTDQVVLTAGTDYELFPHNGHLRGANASVPTVQVDITFNYLPERYDVIQVDPDTLALSVVKGTEREWDAQEDAYRAKPTNGCIPLYYAYVAGSTVKLVDASGWSSGVIQRGRESDWLRCITHGRRILRKTLKKLQQGTAITLAGYGDSITAMQSQAPGTYTANGPYRDRWEYFGFYPNDTIALFTKYDTGDGAGQNHVRLGWNWQLKAFLEERFSSTITYKNYGIGGTTSANTTDSGLYPARIGQIVTDAPDLVVVGFGMNELGQSTTYANVCSIIAQLQAAGSDVIVMGVPRANTAGKRTTMDAWRYTNRQLQRAAIDSGAAWVPLLYAMDDGALGYMGIHDDGLAGSNLYNHPGYREHRLYGQLLSELFA